MDKTKADAMEKFRVSQPFFNACDVFYGDGFGNCLKQVGAVYPDLDLSQIAIDDTVPPTLGGDDTVSDETDDSVHTVKQEVKDIDAEVIVQPTLGGQDAPVVPSAANPTTVDDLSSIPPS